MNPDPVSENARTRPEAVAVVADQGVVTWKSLDHQVEQTVQHLSAAGADPYDVVAVDADYTLRTIIVVHAAWRLGVAIAPLHPGLTPTERKAAHAALEAFEPDRESSVDSHRAQETAAVVWTSGSSGEPRGVALPARSFAHNAVATAQRLGLEPTDRWLTTLSLAHVGGLALLARAAHLGCAVVLSKGFSAEDFRQQCDAARVTHASLVPTMLARLLDDGTRAPDSLRAVLLGGAAAPPSLVERAIALGYPIALTYGMTEAGSQIATATPAQVRADPGSVGAPLDGVELRFDSDGQILVRGPTLATHIVGEGALGIDTDGWLHTGDFGDLRDDALLHVGGRLDARIVTGGVNVDPLEVERALTELPAITSACVVGLPDPEWGERIEAAITVAEGAPDPEIESVRAQLRGRLSAPKLPKRVLVVESLPLGRNKKIDRDRVHEILRTGNAT